MSGHSALREEFLSAEKLLLATLELSTTEQQPQLRELRDEFTKLFQRIQTAEVFSKNETLEDFNAENMKYLLIEHYLALVESKVIEDDRLSQLHRAKQLHEMFLHTCKRIEAIHKDDLKAIEREQKLDGQNKRTELIARAKRDKEAKSNLQTLLARRKNLSRLEDADLDDLDREISQIQLDIAVRQTITELNLLEQEIQLLEHVSRHKPTVPPVNDIRSQAPKRRDTPIPPDTYLPAGITSLSDVAGQRRADLMQQVFRPSWIQATISVEEAAEMDMKYMAKGGGPDSAKKKEEEEDSDPDDNEKYRKEREWDDWKDDHPAGEGNRMTMG